MFQINPLFLLIIIILVAILVLTILTYTKKVIKNVSAGTSNVTVEENGGNAIISVSDGGSGDFLPLSGGTMSGSINMGSQSVINASLVSTTAFTLNSDVILYGLPASDGEDSLNLYVNGTAVAPYLYSIPNSGVAIVLTNAYNGENWVFPSTFSGSTFSIVTNYATLPKGFYLNLTNRKTTAPVGNITINIYDLANPVLPPPITPPTETETLVASTSRYLYFDGTSFSLI
jgi:hypothetical protein